MEKVLAISSRIESLHDVEKAIDKVSSEYKLNNDLYGNVLIATLEATNNAIVHGNKLNSEKKVILRFVIENDDLTITVEDQGPGFDYNNIPDPTSPENIENINGRGIFLMEKLSDKIEFYNNGSIVEMHFKLK